MFRVRPFLAAGLLAVAVSMAACACAQSRGQTAGPATAPARPDPDVLVFTNGDRLTGKFERAVNGSVVFKSDMAGEVTVPLDKVKDLHSDGGFAVLRKQPNSTRTSPRPAAVGDLSIAAGAVTVRSQPAPVTVPSKDVGYIVSEAVYNKELAEHPGPLSGWTGNLNAGATLVRATTDTTTFTAGAALVRAVPSVPWLPARNRTTLNLSETYGRLTTPDNPVAGLAYSQVKSHIFHADAERDEYVSARFYGLADTSFDHNYAQGLALQQNYGGGAGYTPLKTARQQLDVKADIHFERQSFFSATSAGTTPSPTLNLVGATVADTYRVTLPYKLVLTQTADILPAFNHVQAYSANATGTLALPVYKRLAAQFSATDDYLNDPAAGFKKNSVQFVTGITYSLQ